MKRTKTGKMVQVGKKGIKSKIEKREQKWNTSFPAEFQQDKVDSLNSMEHKSKLAKCKRNPPPMVSPVSKFEHHPGR